ncbi:TPA: hypothetical protein DDW35_00190 [Candidatus Sumerlaeota bacterium]|jgi:hypothetical protein|nr:hypothetical protein [Candidatus Sumerlaeota bacterium]
MKSRTIPFLFVSLIVLAVVYYYDHQHIVALRSAEIKEARVLPFAVDKVDTLEFRNPQGTFKLVKLEGVWRLIAPSAKLADPKTVEENILKLLDASTKIGSIPMKDAERKNYGVEKDKALWVRATASHTAKGEPNAVELLLGADTAIPGEIYLWDTANPSHVQVTQQNLRRAFQYGELDLRDKSICEYDIEKALTLEVAWDGVSTLRLQRNETGDWNVFSPSAKAGVVDGTWNPAEKRLVDNLLNTLKTMRPFATGAQNAIRASQVEAQEGKAQLHLTFAAKAANQPAAKVELGLRAVPFDVDLTSGTQAAGNKESAAPTKHAPWIGEVAGNDLLYAADSRLPGWLHNGPEAYRDRQAVPLSADEVTGLHIAITIANKISDTVDLVREKKGPWQFAADKTKQVNQTNVTLYLAYSMSQKIDTFQNDLPSTLTQSLSTIFQQPLLRVQFTAGNKVQGYEIGKPVAQGDSRYFARRLEGAEGKPGEVFTLNLPAQVLVQLLKLTSFFEDRPVLHFNPAEVNSVVVSLTVKDDATTMTLKSSGTQENAAWLGTLGMQKGNTIPPTVIKPFLETLRSVQYFSINNNPDAAAIQKADLGKPAVRIYLYGNQNELLASVAIGKIPENEQDAAMVQDNTGRYLLVSGGSLGNVIKTLYTIAQRLR